MNLQEFEQHLENNPITKEFLLAILQNTTKEFLTSRGIATDKVTTQQMIDAMKIFCKVLTPVCEFVDALPG